MYVIQENSSTLLKSLMPVSLYIHIPFCLKRCIYCDFVSGIYDPERASVYIDALKKELSGIPDKKELSTLYIGGGTPTALPADLLSELIAHIFRNFSFTDDYEATIEANPGTLDREKLRVIKTAGMNRISMGVQSFNDNELEFLGRIHNSGEAEKAVRLARESGFENIGIDLIYGIPGQDITSWQESLNMAVSLKPEHISTYELTVEKGTGLYRLLHPPLSKSVRLDSEGGQRGGDVNLLEEDRIIEMYERTIDYLTSEGYLHYEISNFAKPGCFSRHNLNYWDRGEYYGTGQGAHSFMNNKRFHNTNSLDEYIKAVSENISHLEDPEDISIEAALQEAIFLGLRKTSGLNLEKFSKRYKTNIVSHYQEQIKELQEAGLVEITASDCSYETDLRLTRKGLLLSNEVFIKFM